MKNSSSVMEREVISILFGPQILSFFFLEAILNLLLFHHQSVPLWPWGTNFWPSLHSRKYYSYASHTSTSQITKKINIQGVTKKKHPLSWLCEAPSKLQWSLFLSSSSSRWSPDCVKHQYGLHQGGGREGGRSMTKGSLLSWLAKLVSPPK